MLKKSRSIMTLCPNHGRKGSLVLLLYPKYGKKGRSIMTLCPNHGRKGNLIMLL